MNLKRTPTTSSVTDLHDDKAKICTSIIFQIDTKNVLFNPLQVYQLYLLHELLLTCMQRLHMYQQS